MAASLCDRLAIRFDPNNMSKPCDQENDGSGAIYIEKMAIDAKAWRSRPKKHGFDLLLVNFRKNSKNRQCLT